MKNASSRFLFAFIGFCLFFSIPAMPQELPVNGIVTDAETKESLAFVNIVYNEKNNATQSNIDGFFTIPTKAKISFLTFSYVGYDPVTINLSEIKRGKPVNIRMYKTVLKLNEVTVFPGENPAHRIIRKVIENRDMNNPEKMASFSYTSYNKMFFTFNMDDLKKHDTSLSITDSLKHAADTVPGTSADSAYKRAKKFVDSQHLFLMESVSDRKFRHPDKNNEKVIASRISGLKNPSFAMLATQLQSFSFYRELIMISDKMYLNPISDGSTRKYFFLIEDTTFTEQGDTVFVISYRPFKGKNFNGLKGVLNINTNTYALQTVKAEPAEAEPSIAVKIQQKYEYIDNRQWFPVQLNTDMTFNNIVGMVGKSKVKMIGVGKSYLRNISLNPELDKKEFSNVEVIMSEDAAKPTEEFWSKFRVDSLTEKDKKTYHTIDSVGKKENLDLKLKFMISVARGYIPWHFLNIDYTQILKLNDYEGFRFGMGCMTNEKITKWVSVGGYFAIATKDKAMKFGGKLDFNISEGHEMKLKFGWSSDVYESDGYTFFEDKNLTSSDFFREILISDMDSVEKSEVSFQCRALQYLRLNIGLSQNHKIITDNFRYGVSDTRGDLLDSYNYTEASLKIKFAYNEKFMVFPQGKFSLGTNYPVFWANITKGIEWLDGQYDYTKVEAKISKTFLTKTFGKTHVQIAGGIADGNIPYASFYNGHGSYREFAIEAANSFATMRMNEFTGDRFASFYFKQDFGPLLFRTKKFKPEIAVVNNIGYAEFTRKSDYFDKPVRSFEKGYFESGLIINNLVHQSFIGYGAGAFYRYGPYAFPKPEDNFAFKLSIVFLL